MSDNAQDLIDEINGYLTNYINKLKSEVDELDSTIKQHFNSNSPSNSNADIVSLVDQNLNESSKFSDSDFKALIALQELCESAQSTLNDSSSEVTKAALAFYKLGYQAAIHKTQSYGEKLVAKEHALQSSLQRERPFRHKKSYLNTLRIVARHIAAEEWQHKPLKYGQMCKKVRTDLESWCMNQKNININIMNLIPKTDKVMKEWIKPVAPEHIKQPGFRD